MISKKALNYIRVLLKQPLLYVSREADMLDIGFGEYIPFINHKGEHTKKPQFALHVQCPFRLVSKSGEIIVTAFDMYLNENGEYMQENEWDKLNTNRYDRILNNWKLVNTKLVVESISINNRGDLFVVLNNEDTIEVFVNNSTNHECWRLLSFNTDKEHLVVSDVGDAYE